MMVKNVEIKRAAQHERADERDLEIADKMGRAAGGLKDSDESAKAYDHTQEALRDFVENYSAAPNDPREFSEEEIARKNLDEHSEDLPRVDLGPDWHTYWATTDERFGGPRDIQKKITRYGYKLVKQEEVPGWNLQTQFRPRSGVWRDYVCVNEMILMKVPKSVWEAQMKRDHNDKPIEREIGIHQSDIAKGAQTEYKVRDLDGVERKLSDRVQLVTRGAKRVPITWEG